MNKIDFHWWRWSYFDDYMNSTDYKLAISIEHTEVQVGLWEKLAHALAFYEVTAERCSLKTHHDFNGVAVGI